MKKNTKKRKRKKKVTRCIVWTRGKFAWAVSWIKNPNKMFIHFKWCPLENRFKLIPRAVKYNQLEELKVEYTLNVCWILLVLKQNVNWLQDNSSNIPVFYIKKPYNISMLIWFCDLYCTLCLFDLFPLLLFQIMRLDIPSISSFRSFIFLWVGSSDGLARGREVRKRQPSHLNPLRRFDFAKTCISHRPQPGYTWD